MHAKKHGCWWNRDIGEIVRESGLIVDRVERRQLGTLWILEARPLPAGPLVEKGEGRGREVEGEGDGEDNGEDVDGREKGAWRLPWS